MKNFILTISIILIFISNSIGQNIGDSPQTKLGFTIKINSEILNDSINIFTHLPFNYDKDKEFPLILLLDAHTSFKAFSATTELMAYARTIPTCIVVGFPQYKYADFDSTNMENKMDDLAKFIGQELLPYLKSDYNITKSIIWGQGRQTGLMSSYFMLEYPDLFDGYISDIPDFKLIQDKVYSETAFDKLNDKNIKYFLFGSSSRNLLNEKFLNNLKDNAPKGLDWNYNISEEENMIIYFLDNYMHAIELFFND